MKTTKVVSKTQKCRLMTNDEKLELINVLDKIIYTNKDSQTSNSRQLVELAQEKTTVLINNMF